MGEGVGGGVCAKRAGAALSSGAIARPEGRASFRTPYRATFSRREKGKPASKPSQIGGDRSELIRRYGVYEVGHAGIVGAGASAEIRHRLGEIIAFLACEPRNGRIALK